MCLVAGSIGGLPEQIGKDACATSRLPSGSLGETGSDFSNHTLFTDETVAEEGLIAGEGFRHFALIAFDFWHQILAPFPKSCPHDYEGKR
jgi:hypothetical protein